MLGYNLVQIIQILIKLVVLLPDPQAMQVAWLALRDHFGGPLFLPRQRTEQSEDAIASSGSRLHTAHVSLLTHIVLRASFHWSSGSNDQLYCNIVGGIFFFMARGSMPWSSSCSVLAALSQTELMGSSWNFLSSLVARCGPVTAFSLAYSSGLLRHLASEVNHVSAEIGASTLACSFCCRILATLWTLLPPLVTGLPPSAHEARDYSSTCFHTNFENALADSDSIPTIAFVDGSNKRLSIFPLDKQNNAIGDLAHWRALCWTYSLYMHEVEAVLLPKVFALSTTSILQILQLTKLHSSKLIPDIDDLSHVCVWMSVLGQLTSVLSSICSWTQLRVQFLSIEGLLQSVEACVLSCTSSNFVLSEFSSFLCKTFVTVIDNGRHSSATQRVGLSDLTDVVVRCICKAMIPMVKQECLGCAVDDISCLINTEDFVDQCAPLSRESRSQLIQLYSLCLSRVLESNQESSLNCRSGKLIYFFLCKCCHVRDLVQYLQTHPSGASVLTCIATSLSTYILLPCSDGHDSTPDYYNYCKHAAEGLIAMSHHSGASCLQLNNFDRSDLCSENLSHRVCGLAGVENLDFVDSVHGGSDVCGLSADSPTPFFLLVTYSLAVSCIDRTFIFSEFLNLARLLSDNSLSGAPPASVLHVALLDASDEGQIFSEGRHDVAVLILYRLLFCLSFNLDWCVAMRQKCTSHNPSLLLIADEDEAPDLFSEGVDELVLCEQFIQSRLSFALLRNNLNNLIRSNAGSTQLVDQVLLPCCGQAMQALVLSGIATVQPFPNELPYDSFGDICLQAATLVLHASCQRAERFGKMIHITHVEFCGTSILSVEHFDWFLVALSAIAPSRAWVDRKSVV